MKLTKLTIRNFKGIKKLSLDIENISIIIGPNNCSKSTVLEALCTFGSSNLKLDKIYIIGMILLPRLPFMLHFQS